MKTAITLDQAKEKFTKKDNFFKTCGTFDEYMKMIAKLSKLTAEVSYRLENFIRTESGEILVLAVGKRDSVIWLYDEKMDMLRNGQYSTDFDYLIEYVQKRISR